MIKSRYYAADRNIIFCDNDLVMFLLCRNDFFFVQWLVWNTNQVCFRQIKNNYYVISFYIWTCLLTAVHEKIFIVFMLCSLSHMLATLKVYRLAHPNMADAEKASYLVKKCLFVISILSTVGLLIFFAKHRLLCHEMGKFFRLYVCMCYILKKLHC